MHCDCRRAGIPALARERYCVPGLVACPLGNFEDGIRQIHQGIAGWHAAGAAVALPMHFALLAESYLAAAEAESALKATDDGLIWLENNAEHQFYSVVHLCRGQAFCLLEDFRRGQAEYEQ